MGPSSPVGPLGPGGPASPGCPDSPFSPRSPRGPWRMSGGYRWSRGDLEDQGCSPCFRDTFSHPQIPSVMVGYTQKDNPIQGSLGSSSLQGSGGKVHLHPGTKPPTEWPEQRLPGCRGILAPGGHRKSRGEVGGGVKGDGERCLRAITHLDTWFTLDPRRS